MYYLFALLQSNPVRMTYLTGSGDGLDLHSLLDAGADVPGLFWRKKKIIGNGRN